jgi:hypothetical protein
MRTEWEAFMGPLAGITILDLITVLMGAYADPRGHGRLHLPELHSSLDDLATRRLPPSVR